MTVHLGIRLASVSLVLGLTAPAAVGYIHFPPMTLPKMCQKSHHIRVLKVEKFDKDKGVIVFGVADTLKGEKSQFTSFRHVVRPDTAGTKQVLDWAGNGKQAVMFYIEGKFIDGSVLAVGYVFIDEYCYSVDYSPGGKYWLLLRGEPGMSACYHGSVERLQEVVKETLAGKEVKIPVKEPAEKVDRDKRIKEIDDAQKSNRAPGGPR